PRAFFVRKTDILGDSSSANEFNKNFKVYKHNNCAIMNSNVGNCSGISVIETGNSLTPTTGSRYALAAACGGSSSGYFLVFLTLDQSGDIVNSVYYDFPSGVTG